MRLSPLKYPTYSGKQQQIISNLLDQKKFSMARNHYHRCYDVFSNSASMTLQAMQQNLANEYIINNAYKPFTQFWQQVKLAPEPLCEAYQNLAESYHKQTICYKDIQTAFNQSTFWNAQQAARFAFIINNTVDGIPYIKIVGDKLYLKCEETNEFSFEEIKYFIISVQKTHALFNQFKVSFQSETFTAFQQELTSQDLVLLNLTSIYPVNNTKQIANCSIYHHPETTDVSPQKLNQFLDTLNENKISFVLLNDTQQAQNDLSVAECNKSANLSAAQNIDNPLFVELKEYSKALQKQLKEHADNIRYETLIALGQLGMTNCELISDDVISALLVVLRNDQKYIQCQALKTLGQLIIAKPSILTEHIMSTLLLVLQKNDADVQLQVLKVLQRLSITHHQLINNQQFISALRSIRQDNYPEVLLHALELLQQLGNIPQHIIISNLFANLWDSDLKVRRQSAHVLLKICWENKNNIVHQVIPDLLLALKDNKPYIRLQAVNTLSGLCLHVNHTFNLQIVAALILELADPDTDIRHRTAQIFLNELEVVNYPVINNQIKSALLSALQDDNFYVRFQAAIASQQMGILNNQTLNEQAVAIIFLALRHEDYDIRRQAAQTLGSLGSANQLILSTLFTAIRDSNEQVRLQAAKTLQQLGIENDSILSALLSVLEDQHSDIRMQGIETLGEWGAENLQLIDHEIIAQLLLMLKDNNPGVRSQTLKTFAELMNTNHSLVNKQIISTLLLVVLEDNDPNVRYQAAQTLEQLSKAAGHWLIDHEAITKLLLALKDNNSDVKIKTIEILSQLKVTDYQIISALLSSLADNDLLVRVCILNTLHQLGNVKTDQFINTLLPGLTENKEHGFIKVSIINTLAKLKVVNEQVISALLLTLQDENPEVRIVTAQALIQIGATDNQAIQNKVVLTLAKALRDSSEYWHIQCQAVEPLQQLNINKYFINDNKVISELLLALWDDVPLIQVQAAQTLVQIGIRNPQIIPALFSTFWNSRPSIQLKAANILSYLGISNEKLILTLLQAEKICQGQTSITAQPEQLLHTFFEKQSKQLTQEQQAFVSQNTKTMTIFCKNLLFTRLKNERPITNEYTSEEIQAAFIAVQNNNHPQLLDTKKHSINALNELDAKQINLSYKKELDYFYINNYGSFFERTNTKPANQMEEDTLTSRPNEYTVNSNTIIK